MNAALIARALGGRRSGAGWSARCPAHDDHNPSLSIGQNPDGKILVHCFAGCKQTEVINALRSRGLWGREWAPSKALASQPNVLSRSRDHDVARIVCARAIWAEARYPCGTLAERYLASRKLDLPAKLCSSVLRFHSRCPWQSSFIPCLIASFRSIDSDAITGIHRIRLDRPELWPKADRKMLGAVAGAAIKLDAIVDGKLAIGEGLETALAARQLGFAAVCGASGRWVRSTNYRRSMASPT